MNSKIKSTIEYLSGQVEDNPFSEKVFALDSNWWGVWWGFLIYLIIIFCGQSSKFIYIDF